MNMTSSNFQCRISCKLKPARLLVLAIFYSSFLLVLTVAGEPGAKNKAVYNGQVTSGVTQRISILIGGDGISSNDRIGGLFADEGDGGGGSGNSSTGGREVSKSASYITCRRNGKCCFQYTWAGFNSKIPTDANNATCEYLRKDKRDEGMACFDPLVFTDATPGVDVRTPPDSKILEERSKSNNWNIYCTLEDSCVTLTYYSPTGDRRVANHTKFCGHVTNSNNGQRLENGCYKQKVQSYVREVCVCSDNMCNSAPELRTNRSGFTLTLGVVLLLLLQHCRSHIVQL